MRNFKAIATYTIVGVLSLFGMSHFAYASDFFEWGISSTGIATENLSTAIGESGATNANVQWYVGTYPDTSTNPCASFNFPLSSWDAGYDIEAAFSVGCSTAPADGVFWVKVTKFGGGFDYYASFTRSGGLWSSVLADTSTRFISVDPLNGATISTSTETIGAEVYVNEADYIDGMYLRIRVVNNTLQNVGGSVLDAWNASFGGWDFPLVAGENLLSTTTTFDIVGQVNADYRVYVPNETFLIGFLLSDQIIVSTSTSFFVVQPTYLDSAMASGTDALISALITGTTTQPIIQCGAFSSTFSLETCLISLIVPPTSVLQADFNRFKDGFLSRWPLGYVKRFFEIAATAPTTTLPVLDLVIPGYGEISLDPWAVFDSGSILDQANSSFVYKDVEYGDGTGFRELVEPWWKMGWYLLLGVLIVNRLLGLFKHRH